MVLRLQKGESELKIGAENIHIHPNFMHATYDNDIALIKLRTEVKLGKFVRTVCLPQKQEGDLAIPRKYGLVTGWGATKALKIGQVLTYTDTYRYSNIPTILFFHDSRRSDLSKEHVVPF